MDENTNDLITRLKDFSDQKKFDEIIRLLTDEVISNIEIQEKDIAADLYVRKGTALYNKREYDKAIINYDEAMRINSKCELAFYNRALAKVAKKDDNAILDFTDALNINPNYADAYVGRGNFRRVKDDYDNAISDFTAALKIASNNENAYYNRGLAYYKKALKDENNIDSLKKSKEDFEEYLKLTTEKNDNGVEYAKQYIQELTVWLEDANLWSIKQLVNNIKNELLIKEKCITHYTSLSVLKKLILDKSNFQISEGSFMNDPSEGRVFFKFLKYIPDTFRESDSSVYTFSPKPFIGSFVSKTKNDDLSMWRLYGKENGEEAKGCAITLEREKFIEGIKNSLSNEKIKEARLDDESDVNFYQIAYLSRESTDFYISTSHEKNKKLTDLMIKLKHDVINYKGDSIILLEEYLNSIAFMFKNEDYKNENEVRLVMNGIEFKKKYNMGVSTPHVYIELIPIKDIIVSPITLGPKVDKINEWKTAVHYSYEKEKIPEIKKSEVPFQ